MLSLKFAIGVQVYNLFNVYAGMAKQNQSKNMFKSAASSSLAPGYFPQSQDQASSSKTSRHVTYSSSDGDSLKFVSSTFDGVSSKQTKHKDNEVNHDWFVDVIGTYK